MWTSAVGQPIIIIIPWRSIVRLDRTAYRHAPVPFGNSIPSETRANPLHKDTGTMFIIAVYFTYTFSSSVCLSRYGFRRQYIPWWRTQHSGDALIQQIKKKNIPPSFTIVWNTTGASKVEPEALRLIPYSNSSATSPPKVGKIFMSRIGLLVDIPYLQV